jgi:hypothetical protein
MIMEEETAALTLTLEQARELEALTTRIRQNLKIIREDTPPAAELDELLIKTTTICENLKRLEEVS